MRAAGATPPRVVLSGLALVIALTACGPAPPDAGSLLTQSSQRMLHLKGFHFQMQISGFTGAGGTTDLHLEVESLQVEHALARLGEEASGLRRRRPTGRPRHDERQAR